MDQLFFSFPYENTTKKLLYGRVIPALEDALSQEIAGIKKGDPLRTVLVIVPSSIVGRYLKGIIKGGGIQIYNFRNFALLLTRHYFHKKGLSPIPYKGEEAIARYAIEKVIDAENPLHPYVRSPGFMKLTMAMLKDFRQGNFSLPGDIRTFIKKVEAEAQVQGVQIDAERIYTVLRIFEEFRLNLTHSHYDVEDVIVKSADLAINLKKITGIEDVLLYGFYKLDETQKLLVREISSHFNFAAFLPYLEGNPISESMIKWFSDLGFDLKSLPGEHKYRGVNNLSRVKANLFQNQPKIELVSADPTIQILSCPDPYYEVREIARQILEISGKNDVPFEKMAILLKNSAPYGEILRKEFESLGIPYYFNEGYPPDETAVGKSLLILLNLIRGNLPRYQIMELLSLGKVNFKNLMPDLPLPNPSHWDEISKKAGICKGFQQWEFRLKNLQSRLSEKLKGSLDEEEKKAIENEIAEIGRLFDFIVSLNKDLNAFRSKDSWKVYTGKLVELFCKYIVKDKYSDQIIGIIRRLESLEKLQPITPFEDFRLAVVDLLTSNHLQEGKFLGGCVNIFNVVASIGLTFSVIFIPGMLAGEFPSNTIENPLLTDCERRILCKIMGSRISSMERGTLSEENPLFFSVLISSCKDNLILTFPRNLFGQNSPAVPSPYILEVGKALTGRETFYKEIEKIPGFRFIKRNFDRDIPRDDSLDVGEYLLFLTKFANESKETCFLSALLSYSPSFKSAIRHYRKKRENSSFTSFDGKIFDPEILRLLGIRLREKNLISSPSCIENYFRCPYQFFLGKALSIRKTETPEDVKKMAGIDRGNIFHKIFYHFFMILKKRDLLCPKRTNREECLKIIRELALAQIEEASNYGLTGANLSWFSDKVDILESACLFVDEEIKKSRGTPIFLELSFGKSLGLRKDADKSNPSFEFTPSFDDPAVINLGNGMTFNYYGRIDRVDVDEKTGTVTIIDYKTGKSKDYKPEQFRGGEQMQLPLYLSSIQHVLPSLENLPNRKAIYYFATKSGKFKEVEFTEETLKSRQEDMKNLILGVLEGTRKGIFIPYPGQDRKNCKNCDFYSVCPVDIDRLFEHKKDDDEILNFLRLKEIE